MLTELAKTLGFTAGGMSNLLGRLERQSYIVRIRCADDGRGVQARLTALGKRVVDEAATILTKSEIKHLTGLSLAEQRRLYKSLRIVIEGLDLMPRTAVQLQRAA